VAGIGMLRLQDACSMQYVVRKQGEEKKSNGTDKTVFIEGK
jgi:hypothetical protein